MLEAIKKEYLERSIYFFRNNLKTDHLRGSFNVELYNKIKDARRNR